MQDLFDPVRTDAEIVDELVRMSFVRVGEGHSAHVFGDTDNRVVLKVFPPLNVGTPKELAFIRRNPILRNVDRLTIRFENVRVVQWARNRAKSLVAAILSSIKVQERDLGTESCIRGYKACIDKGLMTRLPTRVISNCMSRLSVKGHGRLMKYLIRPRNIILQKRFHERDVLTNVLRETCLRDGAAEQCTAFIEQAIEYQLAMWRTGLISRDPIFNIFENFIVLPDGTLQLHDANAVIESHASALRFIRDKEQDIHQVFSRLGNGGYPKLLYDTDFDSIARTARELHRLLCTDYRDDLVMHFLERARNTLCEDAFRKNWGGAPMTQNCSGSL